MNDKKRLRLERAIRIIEEGKSIVEDVMSDEQHSYDNLPPAIQESVNGMKMEDAIDSLDDASADLEDAIENMNSAISNINNARL